MWRAVSVCMCLAALCHGEDAPFAVISQGSLQGAFLLTRGGRQFSAFQGIPYASPPVGPLRFQKPVAAGKWEGVRDASQPGSPCIQSNHSSLGMVFGSEDCLYLNVYTHKVSPTAKAPVMVFIHGGAYAEGFGHLYKPTYMMDRDIVLVTINYRLGVLGFLSFEDKELPGNNGMKDQVAALRWLQENIAQFGGDPGSVTIFGESAGAGSVHLLMLSPLGKGLFHRAISMSGTAYCPWASHSPGQLRIASEGLASQLGCNHHDTRDTLHCLRDIPGYVIVELMQTLHEWNVDPIVPFPPAIEPKDVEDAFLTVDPWSLTSEVPWITGITSHEGIFKVKMLSKNEIVELNEEFETLGPLTLLFRTTAEDPVQTAFAVKKFYFLDGDITPDSIDGLTDMYSDSFFTYPTLEAVRRHRGPKYLYYLSYRAANSIVPEYHGVSHFDDMQYLFPMDAIYKKTNYTEEDRKVSEKLLDFWVNFATYGRPTVESSEVTWTESTTGAEYLHISQQGFAMEKDMIKERDNFWSSLPYRDKYLHKEKDEL